jgi:ubiquinone/menaquinone biosynthesis C-methylase UbiE
MDAAAFFTQLHAELPRQAPGSETTTLALARGVDPDGPRGRLLDIGCGPGRSSLALAGAFDVTVVATDLHQPYLDELQAAAAASQLSSRVSTRIASMQSLPFDDDSFDTVWAEACIYIMGFDAALAAWRRIVRPGGTLVITECEYTSDNPSGPAVEFWNAAYPPMRSTAANVAAATRLGWRVDALYRLPERDWWEEYYDPLQARVDSYSNIDEPELRAILDGTQVEIDMRRDHADQYSYTGYVLRKV